MMIGKKAIFSPLELVSKEKNKIVTYRNKDALRSLSINHHNYSHAQWEMNPIYHKDGKLLPSPLEENDLAQHQLF